MMKKLAVYITILATSTLLAQKAEKDKFLPKANEEFAAKNFTEAEANYRISQSKYPTKAAASYNLGNAIYKINKPSEARNAYLAAIKNASSRAEKHRAYHNLGNASMKQKDYEAAVAAYKNALINNPADEETRYNYALAKKMLKENPKPKDKDKDKKDKNPDKKQDQNEKEDDKGKEKDKKLDQGKDQQPKPNQGKPKPEQGDGLSKQRLENLLEAVNNEEKKVQSKVNKKPQGKPTKNEKDW